MDTVIRACFVYFTLLVIFRVAGKRTLAQLTTFDLVLTLIISEAIQEALVDSDRSLTNAFLLVVTLVGLSILLSVLKQRFNGLQKWLEDAPMLIMQDGRLQERRMDKERVDAADILEAARDLQGVSRLDQLQHAVVERTGAITVIPKDE